MTEGVERDRHGEAADGEDQEQQPREAALAHHAAEADAALRHEPLERVAQRLHHLDRDRRLEARLRRGDDDLVRAEMDLVANAKGRAHGGRAVDAHRLLAGALDEQAGLTLGQHGGMEAEPNVGELHLVVAAAPEADAFGVDALRPAHDRVGAAPRQEGDFNLHFLDPARKK